MKKCESCKIEFNISGTYCPLCQNILVGKCEDLIFPKNVRYKTNSLILKLVLFISITLFLLFSFIELLLLKQFNFSIYVGVGLINNFIIIYIILKNYQDIFKMFGKYGLVIVLFLLVWYLLTRSTILTNYIIPSICLIELLFNIVVGIILRKNYLIKYSTQLLMSVLLLLMPIILVLFGLTTNNILSYICTLLSVISILGLLIFFSSDIKEELDKLFNI